MPGITFAYAVHRALRNLCLNCLRRHPRDSRGRAHSVELRTFAANGCLITTKSAAGFASNPVSDSLLGADAVPLLTGVSKTVGVKFRDDAETRLARYRFQFNPSAPARRRFRRPVRALRLIYHASPPSLSGELAAHARSTLLQNGESPSARPLQRRDYLPRRCPRLCDWKTRAAYALKERAGAGEPVNSHARRVSSGAGKSRSSSGLQCGGC